MRIQAMSELREFVEVIQDWHTDKVDTLNKILDTPNKTEIRLGEEDPIVFAGEQAIAFKAGVRIALHYLGKLPFTVGSE